MARPVFAYVRIDHRSARTTALTIVITLGLVAGASSRAQSGKDADPHAHHRAAAAAQAPPSAPSPAVSVPSRSTAITTPSWFAGGQGLYVPHYFDSFENLDLTQLSPSQKERFVHRVNTEFCACNQTGCKRDTIAHCFVTDPACPRAPVRIREILEKVKTDTAAAAAAPVTPSVTITPRP